MTAEVEPAFDDVIHGSNRLQICAMLAAVEALEFAVVREALAISDSVLSKHVKILAGAGYVQTSKVPHGSRTRTWLALTDRGRAALTGHLAELRRIAAMATAVQPNTVPDEAALRSRSRENEPRSIRLPL